MKCFQLIFLVFCVGGAFGAASTLEFPEPLKGQCQAVVQRTSDVTYDAFAERLRTDLKALSESLAKKRVDLLRPAVSEDHERFEVNVERLIRATASTWDSLRKVCPEEEKQKLILSVAMEFLEHSRDKPGNLDGESVFVNLQTYMGRRDFEGIFSGSEDTRVVALYYFMGQFPRSQGVDFSKRSPRRSIEEIAEVMAFLAQAPKSFGAFFLRKNGVLRSDVSLQTLAADMEARFEACFMNTKKHTS